MKKNYIIVDTNNKWQATLENVTDAELLTEVEEILSNLDDDITLFSYETIGKAIEYKPIT